MSAENLKEYLYALSEHKITVEEAFLKLKSEPFDDLGYAKPDYHRKIRQGVPEVIYGEGKSVEHIIGICSAMLDKSSDLILITRLNEDAAKEISVVLPLKYYEEARIGIIGDMPEPDGFGTIVIATGGTSDIPVAEEAAITAEALGNKVLRLYDVGVAGIHRLLANKGILMQANVVISIAGMEGALTSVVAGLVDCPVIGVPTSVGYGAAFGGITALLSMLNSCGSGVSVVNIDNGFGAAYQASMINHIGVKK